MNQNPALLQPADHRIAGSPGRAVRVKGLEPPPVGIREYICKKKCSKKYADDKLSAVILIQVSAQWMGHSIQLYHDLE